MLHLEKRAGTFIECLIQIIITINFSPSEEYAMRGESLIDPSKADKPNALHKV